MTVAVAGIPGAWSSERIAQSLRDEGMDSFVFSLGDVVHDLATGRVEHEGQDLRELRGIVVKKLGDQSDAWTRLRLHALRALEALGVRVFSRPDAIDRAMDRYRMTMMLADAGLPIPETLAAESAAGVRAAVERLSDAVLKPVYTSKGRGMVRVRAAGRAGNGRAPVAPDGQRYLAQRFVDAPGRDIGATVVGGAFLGAFYRIASPGEWMTTTAQGGRYAPCELSPAGIALAERAAAASELDYTVVDLVEQGNGFLVYEVSAFGGFRGLLEASGVDASVAYARFVRSDLGRA